jgi:hypothetical protein
MNIPKLASLHFVGYIRCDYNQLYHLELRKWQEFVKSAARSQWQGTTLVTHTTGHPGGSSRTCKRCARLWTAVCNESRCAQTVSSLAESGRRPEKYNSRHSILTNPAQRRDFLLSPIPGTGAREQGLPAAGFVQTLQRVKKSSF